MSNKHLRTELNIETLEEIGEDGMNSKVYKARDLQVDSIIALKELVKSEFENIGDYFNEARMLHEARHTNVADVKFCSTDDSSIYIAMPFYKNGSLKNLMDQRSLTVREIITIGVQFMSGVFHIHSKNLIHFDIKPSNILFDDSGRALVTDFGLAKYMGNMGLCVQTWSYPRHFVPEYFEAAGRGVKSDIFQIGLTLYRMCNGDSQFDIECAVFDFGTREGVDAIVNLLKSKKFPKRNYKSHIPRTLRAIINKCLEPNPDDRYDSVLDLIDAMSVLDESIDWSYSEENNLPVWRKISERNAYTVKVVDKSGNFNLALLG
jgi:serine/threonine protein kinase